VSAHPWALVAPWYRWPQAGVPGSGRGTAPVFQKFAADRYVNEFIRDPQRSLVFDPAVDEVHSVDYTPAPPLASGALAGKISSLFPLNAAGDIAPSRTRLRSTGMRKIYLDAHSRHYLVVCELHCDVAGFPSPSAREVCQAGLVVRRRHLSYPAEAKSQAATLVKDLVAVEAEIAARRMGRTGANGLVARLRQLFGVGAPALETLQVKQFELRGQLDAWKKASGAHWVVEGWVPGAEERTGAWQVVEDEPQALQEHWFPMWPLFADPTRPQHDAHGATIFFGVLPTSSFDTDSAGRARFDDRTTYEIRCFVRRHDPRCPRGEAPDCHGEVVWSRPTERYRLAPPFDLLGTSNRPVTIQMPNLAELAAQAVAKPLGKYSPVKIVQPQTLAPAVDGMTVSGGAMSGASICFISIPLVTIVALFVFNIFLPIVVFLFGLWFLLAFKFCIPPKVAFDAGLEAKLDAAPPDIDADFSVDVEIGGGVQVVTETSLNVDLQAGLGAGYEAAYGFEAGSAQSKLGLFPDQRDADGNLIRGGMANTPLRDLAGVARDIDDLPSDVANDPPVRGDIHAGLEYEPRRTRPAS